MDMSQGGHIYFVIGYLILIAIFGYYITKKKIKSNEDFMTANRSLPLFIMIGTLLATWYGGGCVTGEANFTYQHGPIAGLLFGIAGSAAGLCLMYFLVGKIRVAGKHTIPELFREKYGPLASLLVAFFIILAYTGIVAYQFKGAGYILNLTTGMNVETGTIIAAILIIFLAASGGMVSIAYTDALSALFMCACFAIGVPLLFIKLGGVGSYFAQIPAIKMQPLGGLSLLQAMGYFLPLILLSLGDQNLFQRYGAAKDVKTARKSVLGFLGGSLLVAASTVVFSASAIILYPELAKPDTALLQVAFAQMPFVLGGVILAAAVAFMVTTGDSFLMSGATNITYDIVKIYFKKDATEDQLLKFTRLTIIILGLIAYFTLKFFPDILSLMMYAFSIYSATVTAPLLAAFLWKGVTRHGGLWSIIIGGTTVLVWELILKNPHGVGSGVVAAPLSFLTLIVVSLLTQKTEQQQPSPTAIKS